MRVAYQHDVFGPSCAVSLVVAKDVNALQATSLVLKNVETFFIETHLPIVSCSNNKSYTRELLPASL